jgi:uncharacterized protein (DUF1778 family)
MTSARTATIAPVKVTPAEKKLLVKAAKSAGVSLASWIRTITLAAAESQGKKS